MCSNTKTLTSIPFQSLLSVIKVEKRNTGGHFTIKSKSSGKDMTFQVKRSEWKGTWYTHVSVERNYLDFLYLGTYRNGNVYSKGNVVTCPSARVIAWVLKYVEREDFDHLNKGAEIMHTGNCLRCGKELTDATSIEIGLGPVCRSL